jgi:hypothetical protein
VQAIWERNVACSHFCTGLLLPVATMSWSRSSLGEGSRAVNMSAVAFTTAPRALFKAVSTLVVRSCAFSRLRNTALDRLSAKSNPCRRHGQRRAAGTCAAAQLNSSRTRSSQHT